MTYDNPFIRGLLPISDDMEPFYDRVLSVKANIFEVCTMTRPTLKKSILNKLWTIVSALERQAATQISKEAITEVATTKGVGVQVD